MDVGVGESTLVTDSGVVLCDLGADCVKAGGRGGSRVAVRMTLLRLRWRAPISIVRFGDAQLIVLAFRRARKRR